MVIAVFRKDLVSGEAYGGITLLPSMLSQIIENDYEIELTDDTLCALYQENWFFYSREMIEYFK